MLLIPVQHPLTTNQTFKLNESLKPDFRHVTKERQLQFNVAHELRVKNKHFFEKHLFNFQSNYITASDHKRKGAHLLVMCPKTVTQSIFTGD